MKKLLIPILVLFTTLGYTQTSPSVIGFEDVNGHFPVEGAQVNNAYFNQNYNVQFFNIDPNSSYPFTNETDLPLYVKVGGSNGQDGIAFGNQVNNPNPLLDVCLPASGGFSRDYPYDATDDATVGCWFLTDNDGVIGQNPKPLRVEYNENAIQNCTTAAGFMYDLDGNTQAEAWRIDLYTVGSSVPNNTIYILAEDYWQCTTCQTIPSSQIFNPPLTGTNDYTNAGDAEGTYFEINSIGSAQIDFLVLTYVGHPNRGVGVAFDFFSFCGINYDPGTTGCDLYSEFEEEQFGCVVQFNNTSSSINGGTTLIGYEWDFGDGTTSNEQHPNHQFSNAGTYMVKLTVTGFNGTECCTRTIEKEVTVSECMPCEAQIGFEWDFETCDGCVMNLKANVYGNTRKILGYYWDLGNGAVASTDEATVQVNGSQQVCLTVLMNNPDSQNGGDICCFEQICDTVTCRTTGSTGYNPPQIIAKTGIKNETTPSESNTQNLEIDNESDELKVYPNPSENLINVDFSANRTESIDIYLISTNGQEYSIRKNVALSNGLNHLTINISKIPSGMYILKIQGESIFKSHQVQIIR